MRVTVVGPGALGCLFASRLLLAQGCDVALLDYKEDRAKYLAVQGISLIEKEERSAVHLPVFFRSEDIGGTDLFLLCVKAHQVADFLGSIQNTGSAGTLIVAMQNGIEHHRVLQENPSAVWAVGVTTQGATLEDVGVVRHGGSGKTVLGFLEGQNKSISRLRQAAHLFTQAGIVTTISEAIEQQVWQKFIINIGINALTVLYDCPNGELLQKKEAKRRMERVVVEAIQVAKARNITLQTEPLETVLRVCKSTADNISSMLQDVRMKRKTEIEAINGALVQEARLLEISVPENEHLLSEVLACEKEYLS